MMPKFLIIVFAVACVIVCGRTSADTTVGDFEALNHEQRVTKLTELTNRALDKILAKNPILALNIQEYIIIPPPGEKFGKGAVALEKQIDEYNCIDPQGYTIENAFAKVLSDYLGLNVAATQPTTKPATQPVDAAEQRH